jgi:hypothetical protein
VVNGFGQPIPEADFLLAVDKQMELFAWALDSNSAGVLKLPKNELSDQILFRILQGEGECLL